MWSENTKWLKNKLLIKVSYKLKFLKKQKFHQSVYFIWPTAHAGRAIWLDFYGPLLNEADPILPTLNSK